MFSMPVHDNYLENKGELYVGPGASTLRGYHMQPILAYDAKRDAVGIPVSWPRTVGDNGVIWMSMRALYEMGKEFWCAVIDFLTFQVPA